MTTNYISPTNALYNPKTTRGCSICNRPHYAMDYCNMHYQRWRTHGDPKKLVSFPSPGESFVARIDKTDQNGCWLWTGCRDENGYGQLMVNGKPMRAHRFSWQFHNGPIPEGTSYHGTCVLHKGDNPPCVNPDHLFLGTQQDNVVDRDAKGRGSGPMGEANASAKLTDRDIIFIRTDTRFHRIVAVDYGLSRSTVSAIKARKLWAHVK